MSTNHKQVGFSIALTVNSEEGETFWMMLVTRREHVNIDAFTNDFGNYCMHG